MPLFVDEEGRTYYSITALNPVTFAEGQYVPWHRNRSPDDIPVTRPPLLQLPPPMFERLLRLCSLMACFNIIILAAAFICWWSNLPWGVVAGIAPMMATYFFQVRMVPRIGTYVPFDRPVRYWGRQPIEILVMELSARLGMILFLAPFLHPETGSPAWMIAVLLLVMFLALSIGQMLRRLFMPKDGRILYP